MEGIVASALLSCIIAHSRESQALCHENTSTTVKRGSHGEKLEAFLQQLVSSYLPGGLATLGTEP